MYIVQLDFECVRDISNILFYSGMQWYACISNSIKEFLNIRDKNILADIGIKIMPVRNGISSLHPSNQVSIWLFFNEENKQNMVYWLCKIMDAPVVETADPDVQFSINESLSLKKHTNIADNKPFSLDSVPLSEIDWQEEVQTLYRLNEITIHFISPLRLKRPNKFKEVGHKYFDEDYFDIGAFVELLARHFYEDAPEMMHVKIEDKSLTWIDMLHKNSIGGVMGTVILKGRFSTELIELLVKGQYVGIGKNSSFGFGQYRIKESSRVRKISFKETQHLYSRLIDRYFLSNVLESMDKDIVDFDGISYSDVINEKNHFINSVRNKIDSKTYRITETQSFKKKKKNGDYRTIVVNNFTDRFVFKALSKLLADTFDHMFYDNSFAYRLGYGHHRAVNKLKSFKNMGYNYGIKADIEAFFDSIPMDKVYLLIRSFLFDDPIVDFLESILPVNKVGLDQGNALSPLFSNLYMLSFDAAIKNSPYVMIRYADDFVILSKTKQSNLFEFTENLLKKLNLKLSLEKTVSFEADSKIEFLGSMINEENEHLTYTVDNVDSNWTRVFDRNKLNGAPVYISSYQSYARTEKQFLIIETNNASKKILWDDVQRLVIVGKPRVSVSVIQRAMSEDKPIQFLNLVGDAIGGFTKHQRWLNVKEFIERRGQEFGQFSQHFTRSIIKSKLLNQRRVLRDNGIESDLTQKLITSIKAAEKYEVMRSLEGTGSAEYFKHFKTLVSPFSFEDRQYYPPFGPVNAMLSLGYTLIHNRISESLISRGFYPYEGMYSKKKGYHKALASELMEPFRFIPEKMILYMIHTAQINENDFIEINTSSGKCTRLHGGGFRRFIDQFEWTMKQEIKVKGKKISYNCLLDDSVRSLYKCIVLGIPYNPFFLN